MVVSDLPMGSAPAPLRFEHFPTVWQTFLWRNHSYFPEEKLAEILQCPVATVREAAAALGLPPQRTVNPKWLSHGYLTIIRENWHILNYRQMLQLLGWKAEQLAYTLKEEDFCWGKLGALKPDCPEVKYAPLTPEQEILFRKCENAYGVFDGETINFYYQACFQTQYVF